MKHMKPIEQLRELEKLNKAQRLAAEGWDMPWKTLIAIMLSARSRDDRTILCADALFRKYDTIEELAKAKIKDVEEIIRAVNFYITKAKNAINLSNEIVRKYNGQVPMDFEKLIELPGVGRKTANVFLAVHGQAAIGVDTHITQIAHKLGWSRAKKPEQIEEDLKKLFPMKLWARLNYILVGFGRSYSVKEQNHILETLK